MKGFYSWVFENQDKNMRSTHISLYMFLLNQNNRNNWVEWFKCPFDLAMSGSGITNKNTYYKSLQDLQDYGLIEYKPGVNNYKAPLIKLEVLFDTATVPQSEPQLIPLPLPLLQPQLRKNIKLLTNNLQRVTMNIDSIIKFLDDNEDEPTETLIDELNKEDGWNDLKDTTMYNITKLAETYLKDQSHSNTVCKSLEITRDELFKRLNKFNKWLASAGETEKSRLDYASHFRNWNLKQPTKQYHPSGTIKK